VLYDTLTLRAKPANNVKLSHCSRCVGNFDESHHYKTDHSVGWQITRNADIELKPQVTTMPGFHSLHNWWFGTMWLFSDEPKYAVDETVTE
jgi:hypothetical protein